MSSSPLHSQVLPPDCRTFLHRPKRPAEPVREASGNMTTIKASCPSCGDDELTSAQVRLVVCSIQDWSFYAFTCHTCHDEVRKPAASDVITLLQSGGVLAEVWAVPAEALEKHDGDAISYDDVLDFALRLQALDDVTAALAPVRPGVPAR